MSGVGRVVLAAIASTLGLVVAWANPYCDVMQFGWGGLVFMLVWGSVLACVVWPLVVERLFPEERGEK